jgi:hypothetical protein
VPVDALSSLCASTPPQTRRDHSLCDLIGDNDRDSGGDPSPRYFDVTFELCGSVSGYRWNGELSPPFRQAYFANGTIWEDVQISGAWQSIQRTLGCLMNSADVTTKIEYVALVNVTA